MLDIGTIILHARWLELEKCFFIYSSEHVSVWKNEAFTWHEESFYGTFLRIGKYGDEKEGVILSPWDALRFFSKPSANSLAKLSWDESANKYLEIAPILSEIISSDNFAPDFEKWSTGSICEWKANKDEHLDPFAKAWLSLAIKDLILEDPLLKNAWEELNAAFPLLENIEGRTFVFDEQDWLKKIGWEKDDAPFQVALELVEPSADSEDWLLKTILQARDKSTNVYEWNPLKKLPKKWEGEEDKIQMEHRRWSTIAPWLKEGDYLRQELTDDEAWLFLTDVSHSLVNAGVEILLPSWWKAIKDTKIAMKAKVKQSSSGQRKSFVGLNALIDFDWRFSTNGVDLSEAEFMSLVAEKRKLIQIKGKWIQLDPAFIKQVKLLLEKANKEGLRFRDILEQQLLGSDETSDVIDETRVFKHVQIQLNKHVSDMMKQLTENKGIPPVKVPESFCGNLRPYQQQGVDWLVFMRKFGFGACLADDMGLGKTIQMIAYFLSVKEREKLDSPHLIICPTSVIGNWQKEIERFAPCLKVKLYYGSNRAKGEEFASEMKDADIVITSYGLAQADEEKLTSFVWETICLDEAQNIKNAGTKQSRAIRRLNGIHKIALTGTPMENRLTELWAIYDFINHGYLGSLGQFQRQFVGPIEKDRDEIKIDALQRMIRPFLLRRTKTDEEVALNLPEKLEQKEYCALTVEQASLYEQLVTDTFAEIEKLDGFKRRGLILKLLGKLKQICNHPALYLKEPNLSGLDLIKRSNKLGKLMELTENIYEHGESCLIFTQYIAMGEMLKSLIEAKFGMTALYLNGSVPKTQRDEMIASFQNHEYKFFILSLKAGGTGLNLTSANHVIHYDRWWNPAVENQATDRAYRIGQQRFVHVHKLITTGTLEEKIDFMLEQKQSLNDEIIRSENWITELSNEELLKCLTPSALKI